MDEDEYKWWMNKIGALYNRYPYLDRKDMLHDILMEEGTPTQRMDRFQANLHKYKATHPVLVCCGGDINEFVDMWVNTKERYSSTIYKHCSHCDQILPESEFRNVNGFPAKICKSGENALDVGRIRNSRNYRANNRKSIQKSRDSLSDRYIKDILRKQGIQSTQENIENKRSQLMEKRKVKLARLTK